MKLAKLHAKPTILSAWPDIHRNPGIFRDYSCKVAAPLGRLPFLPVHSSAFAAAELRTENSLPRAPARQLCWRVAERSRYPSTPHLPSFCTSSFCYIGRTGVFSSWQHRSETGIYWGHGCIGKSRFPKVVGSTPTGNHLGTA